MTTNGISTNGVSSNGAGAFLELSLHISDRDLFDALIEYPEGEGRDTFALSALKIGVIALHQAQGRIDADRVRQEGDRFIENMGHTLSEHRLNVIEQIGNSLKVYFDPMSGQFNDRVQRLIGQDGELERVVRKQIEGSDSVLAQTLTAHVGQDSQLMQVLDPSSSDGLLFRIKQSTEDTIIAQRERILSEFSKDNPDSAINRMVSDLTNSHGEVGKALEERIEQVTKEFSLDNENSALSRLVGRVETAQGRISNEFDLNKEDSALARMRKELLDNIEIQRQTNEKFQQEVIGKLTEMTARKQEADRSTRHGLVFEEAVFDFLNERSQDSGDIAISTGNTAGLISRNRKGDVVVEIGPEHAAAGAKIVVEAKEDASYTLNKAIEELQDAKKNRGAEVGIFVFSKRTVPNGVESFRRYGNDIVVSWDPEDVANGVFLDAGLSVAKALSVRAKTHSKEVGADFEAIEKAIRDIEKQSSGLEEITTLTTTIKNNSEKILTRARIVGQALTQQIGILDEKVAALREVVGSTG